MQSINLTQKRCDIAKTLLKKNLGIKSSHLSEALARGLGFKSNIALLASVRESRTGYLRLNPNPETFMARLGELGRASGGGHAEAAFVHALYMADARDESGSAPHIVERMAKRISDCALVLKAARPWTKTLLAYEDAPDPTVKTVRIDRDIWRWHPMFIEGLSTQALVFLIFSAGMHRMLGHPARRGERDMRTWSIACDLVVHHAAVTAKIGESYKGFHFDHRFHSELTAEEVHDLLASGVDAARLRYQPNIDQGTWSQPKKAWPTTAKSLLEANPKDHLPPVGLFIDRNKEGAEIPDVIEDAILSVKAAIAAIDLDGVHDAPTDRLPSATVITAARDAVDKGLKLSLMQLTMAMLKSPALMKLPVNGDNMHDAVMRIFKTIALFNLSAEVSRLVARHWHRSTSTALEAMTNAKRAVGAALGVEIKPYSGISPIPSAEATDSLIRMITELESLVAHANAAKGFSDELGEHRARIRSLRTDLEAIRDWLTESNHLEVWGDMHRLR